MAGTTGPPTQEHMRLVAELWEKHRRLLYKFARGRNRGDAEADDIVSETLLRLFRNAETLRRLDQGRTVDYITKTVLSVASDHDRRRRTEARLFAPLEEEPPDARAAPDPEATYVGRVGERRGYVADKPVPGLRRGPAVLPGQAVAAL